MNVTDKFWECKSLQQLTAEEWEQLCDGCGQCCLHKFIDDETGELFGTDVACKLLDTTSCRCTKYETRHQYVPDCTTLTLQNVHDFDWLPATCAYRLRAAGKPLPDWHPLVTGRADSVHIALQSVRDKCISERDVLDIESRIIENVTQFDK